MSQVTIQTRSLPAIAASFLLPRASHPWAAMRIAVDLAQQMAGEQPGLHMQHAAHGTLIAEQRVGGFLVQTPFKGTDQCAPPARRQVAARSDGDEVRRGQFPVVQRGQHRGIGQDRAQRSHQVERQGRSARSVGMVQTSPGIQSGDLQRRGTGAGQQRVAGREAGVDRIGRRSSSFGRPSVSRFRWRGRARSRFRANSGAGWCAGCAAWPGSDRARTAVGGRRLRAPRIGLRAHGRFAGRGRRWS